MAFTIMVEPTFGAATAVRIGASVVGSVLTSSSSISSSNNQKSTKRSFETLPQFGFVQCLSEVHQNPPHMIYNSEERSAEMHQVPASCMYHAYEYLKHPDVKYMNHNQGHITIINQNSLRMESMPDPRIHREMMEKLGGVVPEKGCHA